MDCSEGLAKGERAQSLVDCCYSNSDADVSRGAQKSAVALWTPFFSRQHVLALQGRVVLSWLRCVDFLRSAASGAACAERKHARLGVSLAEEAIVDVASKYVCISFMCFL